MNDPMSLLRMLLSNKNSYRVRAFSLFVSVASYSFAEALSCAIIIMYISSHSTFEIESLMRLTR